MINLPGRLLRLVALTVLILACGRSHSAEFGEDIHLVISHNLWDDLLKKHVKTDGLVDYKGFISDKERFDQYLTMLDENEPNEESWSREQQLAYWINAYNAFTVKLIIDNYPLKSIKDLNPILSIPTIRSIWSKKLFTIGGKEISLDEIEHDILRKKFQEPRIHFAINCASFSCPVMRAEAYIPSKIDEQLEQQTVLFLNDPRRNVITTDNPKVSKIFSWFSKDFKRNGTVIDFINKYLKDVQIDRGADLDYLDYDWKLNEAE